MVRRRGRLWPIGLLGFAALLAACSGVAGTPTVSTDYSHLAVTAAHTVTAPGLTPRSSLMVVSPNGSKVYSVSGGRPCISTLATGATSCAKAATVRPSAFWAAWSPDGSTVAFTDDFRVSLGEPDIWVMDATSGAVRDLTDDGASGGIGLTGSTVTNIDVLPSWAGADRIVFARQRGLHGDAVTIESIPASGGTATSIGTLRTQVQFLNGMAISPDGGTLAYSQADDTMTAATVHLRSITGHALGPNRVAAHSRYDASWLAFSPDGTYLLAQSMAPASVYTPPKDPESLVIPVGGGAATPVAAGAPAWYAGWSPTGHALAFVTRSATAASLQVVTKPGGAARALGGDPPLGSPGRAPTQPLAWTPSGIVVRTGAGLTVLDVA